MDYGVLYFKMMNFGLVRYSIYLDCMLCDNKELVIKLVPKNLERLSHDLEST